MSHRVASLATDEALTRFSKTRYWDGYLANTATVGILVACGLWRGPSLGLRGWLATVMVAAFTQSLAEYLVHRFVYHLLPTTLEQGHRLHHDQPRAPIGPPWYSAGLVVLGIYGVLAALLGAGVGVGFGLLWFFQTASSAIHDALHHRRWRWRWFRRLQHFHNVHHRLGDRNFGISLPLWDLVLGTADRRR